MKSSAFSWPMTTAVVRGGVRRQIEAEAAWEICGEADARREAVAMRKLHLDSFADPVRCAIRKIIATWRVRDKPAHQYTELPRLQLGADAITV